MSIQITFFVKQILTNYYCIVLILLNCNDFRFWVADYNVKTESEELYNTFAYWREPICDTKLSFNFEVKMICFITDFVPILNLIVFIE